jgi:uncharacterized protein
MKIDIHRIPTQGLTLDFERPAQHFSGLKAMMESGECEFVDPVAIHLDVMPMRDFIRINGRLDTALRQACVRCLETFQYPLQCRFTLNYSREIPQDVHNAEAEGIELTADQIGMVFFEGDEIDFTDALQEQVILAMPFKPICRSDCLGLCPRCGKDLNFGPCLCGAKEPDGPFAVLKNMKLPLKR